MGACVVCGAEDELQYTCNHCERTFCSEHRLPESHSCPALLTEKADESWFDTKFEDVEADKSTKSEESVSRSDHIHDSKSGAKESGNYTVADANPEEYADKSNDSDYYTKGRSTQQDDGLDTDKNYSVADANSDESDDEHETVDPDTKYRSRDIEPEYEHESPELNPDGSLKTPDDGDDGVDDAENDKGGLPPLSRMLFMLLILGVIAASAYFLML